MEREINGKLIKLVLPLLFPSWYFDAWLDCPRRSPITEIRSREIKNGLCKIDTDKFYFRLGYNEK